MMHTISGNSFHGHYSINLRGPAQGFWLSPAQQARVEGAKCPSARHGCACGGEYGDGADSDAAWIDYEMSERRAYLRPAA